MKRYFTFLLASLIAVCALAQIQFTSGKFKYEVIEGTDNLVQIIPKSSSESGAGYSNLVSSDFKTSVTYDGVTYTVVGIGANAFYRCTLNDQAILQLPEGFIFIDEGAFAYTEVGSLKLPTTMQFIAETAFNNNRLAGVTVLAGNPYFAHLASTQGTVTYTMLTNKEKTKIIAAPGAKPTQFSASGTTYLTSITIPSSVTSIDILAFAVCSSLSSIVVESENSKYDSRENCNAIIETSTNTLIQGCKNTIIPNSVTSIGFNSFYGCSGLTSLTIPNCVTTIGGCAFEFSGLTSISIGSGVNKIGNYAFSYCSELTDVYCYAEKVPSTDADVFNETPIGNITLHVPESLINDYMAIKPWRHFKDIVKIDMPEYTLTYIVDEEVYKTFQFEVGETITPEPAPIKEGYTFSGWSEIPETMPAKDVTVTGMFSINSYKLTYMIDDKVYKETTYEYGATITAEPQPEGDYATFEWIDLPQTMPAHDVVVYASYTSGIIEVLMASQQNVRIYSSNGKKLNKMQKGLNIVIIDDGTVKKVIVK